VIFPSKYHFLICFLFDYNNVTINICLRVNSDSIGSSITAHVQYCVIIIYVRRMCMLSYWLH